MRTFKYFDEMSDNSIQKGSTVTLKSGGPLMTVEYIDSYEAVSCSWFDGKSVKRADFQLAALKISSAEG